MAIYDRLLCESRQRARENREIVADHLFTLGYIEQETLRERWITGEEKPVRLIVEDNLPEILPSRYHPLAGWRTTDGKGRKPIMKGWMGELGYALDLTIEPDRKAKVKVETSVRLVGEIEFCPNI